MENNQAPTGPRLLFLLSMAALSTFTLVLIPWLSSGLRLTLEHFQMKELPPATKLVLTIGPPIRSAKWVAVLGVAMLALASLRGYFDRALSWLTGAAIVLLFAASVVTACGIFSPFELIQHRLPGP